MKLYNMTVSPFAARCRIQIYAKGLDVEFVEMPVQLPDDYAEINPIRRVPALEVDDTVIPESQVICEYLEDAEGEDVGSGPSLRPDDAQACAEMRLLTRIADIYIMEHMEKLYGYLRPETRDKKVMAELGEGIAKGLGFAAHYLSGDRYAVDGELSLADCALMPVLYYVKTFCPALELGDLLIHNKTAASYYFATLEDPHVGKVIGEIHDGLQPLLGAAMAP